MSDVFLIDLNRQLAELFAKEHYAAGFALGRHILHHYPHHLPTYKQMGLAALAAGLMADSVDLLQRALSVDPEDGEMWAALHEAATRLDLHPDAEVAGAYAHDLLQFQAGDSFIARGHAAARAKEWEKAYEAYRQGFLAHPERMDAGLGLMTALFRQEQWRSVLKVAQRILEELPYSLKALWFTIRCVAELGDDDSDSVKKYRRIAYSIDPDNIYARKWLDDASREILPKTKAKIAGWDPSERWEYVDSIIAAESSPGALGGAPS